MFGARAGQRPPRFILGGALLALAVACRYQAVVPCAAMAGVSIWFWQDDPRLPRFVWSGVSLMILLVIAKFLVFGGSTHTLSTPYGGSPWPNLAGLLASPGKGLLIFSPWTVLSLFAPWILFRRRRGHADWPLVLACVAAIGAQFLLLAKYGGWYGGWSWGWRLLLDVAPALTILLALGADAVWGRCLARWLAVALVGAAIAIQALGALAWDNRWHRIFDVGAGHFPAWLWQWRNGPIAYYASRGLIYIGDRPVSLWPDPWQPEGLYAPEEWDGEKVAWLGPKVRFLAVTRGSTPEIRLFPPSGLDRSGMTIQVQNAAARTMELNVGQWNAVRLPELPPMAGAWVELEFEPTWVEPGEGGRELGAAMGLGDPGLKIITK